MSNPGTEQQQTRKSTAYRKRFAQVMTAVMIPLYTLVTAADSYAIVPEKAEVYNILGRNDLGIRRRSQQYGPAQKGAFLNLGDSLHIPGSGRSFAQLRFHKSGRDMGLQVQASTKNKLTTLYYFPCRFLQGDSMIIEWGNEKTGWRGCEKGVRVQRGKRQTAQVNSQNAYAIAPLKQVLTAQANRSKWEYCSVLAADGRGWLGMSASGDACEEPLQQCKAGSPKGCEVFTKDNWAAKAQQLTASVKCADKQVFTEKAAGAAMKDVASKLWQQAQTQGAKFCGFHTVDSEQEEVVVAPVTKEQTLIQTRNTDNGVQVDVIKGEVDILSNKQPQGVTLTAGQRYNYFGDSKQDQIEPFDNSKESIELQVLFAERRGLKLCDQEQVSGGQAGDKRTIQLTANEGKIRIDYEMFGVPDKLQVLYEGRSLLDTDFVSGSNSVEVAFKGDSGQVQVELTGNSNISTTQWKYTLYCPQ